MPSPLSVQDQALEALIASLRDDQTEPLLARAVNRAQLMRGNHPPASVFKVAVLNLRREGLHELAGALRERVTYARKSVQASAET